MNVYVGTSGELKNAYIGQYGRAPSASTIAYYYIDNSDATTIYDKANSYDLTCNASYTNDTNAGRCLSLTVNSGASLGAYIDFGTTYTAHVWFKCTGTTSGRGNIFNECGDGNGVTQLSAIAMYVRNDPLYEFRTGSRNLTITSGITVMGWHLYTFTRGTDGCVAYIDGVQKASMSYNAVSYNVGSYFELGGYSKSWGPTGLLKSVIIERNKRTAQEVADYYNQTKSNYGL